MPQLHEIVQQGREGRCLGPETSSAEIANLLKRGYHPDIRHVVYFGGRLCPYAHRVWWALTEKGIDHDYIHIDLGKNKPAWYQKYVNPYGTVPCLYVDGKGVFESGIICEYIDEMFPDEGPPLMPEDPFDRAAIRMLVSHFNERTIPPLYRCLKAQTPAEVKMVKEVILVEMLALEAIYAKHAPRGSFFLGSTFSLAEIMIFPFIERMCVALKHYRGLDPLEDAALPRLQAAFHAVKQRPAHKATTQAREFYIQVYDHYANPVPLPPVSTVAVPPCATPPARDAHPDDARALGWRIAAFFKHSASVPLLAVPIFMSSVTFLLGCGLGWVAGKGPKRYGGYIK